MAHQYVSPADKLARQILKAAIKHLPGQLLLLPVLRALVRREATTDLSAVLDHAVHEGWLTEQEGAWLLTADGETMGKRFRAGIRNKARAF